MAKKKKSRVPPPPRTSQGPQQRAAGPQRRVESGGPRRLNLWFVGIGVAIIVAAAIVGIFFATRSNSAEASGPSGSCVRETFPPMGRQHIEKLSSSFRYNSYPPTSGPHYPPGPKAPAVWNLYDKPVDETALVHNLEHGGIVIQYGADVPASTVAQIANWYQSSDPNGIVTARTVAESLSQRAGRPLPWSTIRTAIAGALNAQFLQLANAALASRVSGAIVMAR